MVVVVRVVVVVVEDKIVRLPESPVVVVVVGPLVSVPLEAARLQNRAPTPKVVGGMTVVWLHRNFCTTEHQQLADSERMLSGERGIGTALFLRGEEKERWRRRRRGGEKQQIIVETW